jgi:hypothetical protein
MKGTTQQFPVYQVGNNFCRGFVDGLGMSGNGAAGFRVKFYQHTIFTGKIARLAQIRHNSVFGVNAMVTDTKFVSGWTTPPFTFHPDIQCSVQINLPKHPKPAPLIIEAGTKKSLGEAQKH